MAVKKTKRGRPVASKKTATKRGRPAKSEPIEKVVTKKRGRPAKVETKPAPKRRLKKDVTPNLINTQKYTEVELEKARTFLQYCDSRVSATIRSALTSTPKESWNLTTTIVINHKTDVLNTHALAKFLIE